VRLEMVYVFLLHGANFLTLKLDDKLRERARAAARILYIFSATMVVVLAISTYIYTDIGINSGVRPIASVVVLLVTIYFINRKMEGWAFVMLGLNIILTQIAFLV